MPDFGIGEALAVIGSLFAEGAGAVGSALGGTAAAGAGAGTAGSLGTLAATGAGAGVTSGLGAGTLATLGAAGAGAGVDAAFSGGDLALGGALGEGAHSLGGDLAGEGLTTLDSAFSGSTAPFGTLGNEGLASGVNAGAAPGIGTSTSPGVGAVAPAPDLGGASLDEASSIDKLFADPSFSNITGALSANKDLIGLGGLAYNATQSALAPGETDLRAQADSLSMQSNQLRSGSLPPGIQSGIDSAAARAKATMRSMFASKGMSDSSSEAATLASIDQRAAQQGAEMAMKLIDTGISEAGMANQLYVALMKQAMERDNALGTSIGRFATALAGGNPYAKAA